MPRLVCTANRDGDVMKLYGSKTSPFVRKIRVLAAEFDLPVTFVPEDPWAKSELLLGLNPLGKVPVLVMPDGQVVYDSLAIIDALDQSRDEARRMIPSHGPKRIEALQWHVLAHGLIEAAVNRLLETRRPDDKQMPEMMVREEQRFARTLDRVEHQLAGRSASAGAQPDFVALMLGVAMLYADFRYPHDWRATHPHLASLIASVAERPSFTLTEPTA